jgi:hypothetical protein
MYSNSIWNNHDQYIEKKLDFFLSDLQTSHHKDASDEMESLLMHLKMEVSELKLNITSSESKLRENSNLIRDKINQNTAAIIDVESSANSNVK